MIAVLRGHGAAVTSVTMSGDAAYALSTSNDGTARLWHAAAEVGAADYNALVWDVTSGARIHVMVAEPPLTARVWSAGYGPDGGSIVTTTLASSRVFDAASATQILALDDTFDAEFSPNGQRLVSAGMGTAKLWDVATGGEIAVLGQHEGWAQSAAFDPAGRRVVTVGDDDVTRIFEVFPTTQELIDHARSIVPRQLTPCERRRFFLAVDGEVGDCR